MRVLTSDRLGCGATRGLVALVALAWAVFAPGGFFWAAVLAAGLVGAGLATALLVRDRDGSLAGAGDRERRERAGRRAEEEEAMKVRPLHDRLLVRRLEEKETARGGIIIPDTAKEKPMEGKVLAVGNGRVLENGKKLPLDVKVGDKILFGKYSGTEIKIDGEEVLIVREDEVLAIMG